METIKLSVEIEKESLPLLRKFMENIKGVVKVEEDDDLLEHFLEMEHSFLTRKLEVISNQDFKKNIEDKICELYSQK